MDNSNMLLMDFFERIYRIKRLRTRSLRTVKLYKESIDKFGKALERRPTLDDLNDDTLLFFLERLKDAGLSPASRNKHGWQIGAMWRLANRLGYVKTWPTLQAEKTPSRIPVAWTLQELERIVIEVRRLKGRYFGVPRAIYFECLMRVLLESGERISAVMGVSWGDLNDDCLLVRGELRKGRTSDQLYRLSPSLVEALQTMKGHQKPIQPTIFSNPLFPGTIWTLWGNLLKRAGLPHGPKDKFHKFRKTTASILENQGMDSTKALDHSRREITTKSYIDPRFVKEVPTSRTVCEWLNGLFGDSGFRDEPQENKLPPIASLASIPCEYEVNTDLWSFTEALERLGFKVPSATYHHWYTEGVYGLKLKTETLAGKKFVRMNDLVKFLERMPNAAKYRVTKFGRVRIEDGMALCEW